MLLPKDPRPLETALAALPALPDAMFAAKPIPLNAFDPVRKPAGPANRPSKPKSIPLFYSLSGAASKNCPQSGFCCISI